MEKDRILYWTDVIMGISFFIVFLTGLVKYRLIKPYFTWLYEIIPGKQMAMIHDWSGILMGVFVFIHLALHWNWMVDETKKLFDKKEIYKEEHEKK